MDDNSSYFYTLFRNTMIGLVLVSVGVGFGAYASSYPSHITAAVNWVMSFI
jgi:hypothetical protein